MIHTNRGNKCKIISIDAEKALDKMNTDRYLEKKNLASSRDGKGFALLEINIYIYLNPTEQLTLKQWKHP